MRRFIWLALLLPAWGCDASSTGGIYIPVVTELSSAQQHEELVERCASNPNAANNPVCQRLH